MANYWASYTTRKMIRKKHHSSSSSGVKKQKRDTEDIIINVLLIIGIACAAIFGLIAVITGDVRFLAAIAASAGFAVIAPIAAMIVSNLMCRKK